jgi:phage terminase large subunit-like protein
MEFVLFLFCSFGVPICSYCPRPVVGNVTPTVTTDHNFATAAVVIAHAHGASALVAVVGRRGDLGA